MSHDQIADRWLIFSKSFSCTAASGSHTLGRGGGCGNSSSQEWRELITCIDEEVPSSFLGLRLMILDIFFVWNVLAEVDILGVQLPRFYLSGIKIVPDPDLFAFYFFMEPEKTLASSVESPLPSPRPRYLCTWVPPSPPGGRGWGISTAGNLFGRKTKRTIAGMLQFSKMTIPLPLLWEIFWNI